MRKIQSLPPLGLGTATDEATVLGRQRALAAVDDGVGQILAALEAQGQLANTLIVFAGDNGYFYGEHGLNDERRLAYEESARIPIVARFPALIPARSTPEQLVLNIDIAPTVLELAGIARPVEMEGRSLAPLFRGAPAPWRSSFVIEYFTDTVFPRVLNMGYQSVRTEQWKYIRYRELKGMDELYDLRADPYELFNVIGAPDNKKQLLQLQEELDRLLAGASPMR
jgi:N-acetylglucosamine-6-sulfatase